MEAARRGEKERETATKYGGGGGESERRTEAEGHWERFVELVQTVFWDRDLSEEATWQAVVLILKGKGDYQGIGLVEVLWKVVAVILNCRLTSPITFHDVLYGFGQVAVWGPPPSRPSCYSSL